LIKSDSDAAVYIEDFIKAEIKHKLTYLNKSNAKEYFGAKAPEWINDYMSTAYVWVRQAWLFDYMGDNWSQLLENKNSYLSTNL
jgi:hypothetical protein